MKSIYNFLLESLSGNTIIEFTIPDASEVYKDLKKKKIKDAEYTKPDEDEYMTIKFDDKSDNFVKFFFGDDVYNRLDDDDLINGWLNVYYDALWCNTDGNCDVPDDFEAVETFGLYGAEADTKHIMKVAKNKLKELGYKL